MSVMQREKNKKLAPLTERLARIGLVGDWDFVLHLPLRYEDLTRITPLSHLHPGATAQVQVRVIDRRVNPGGRGDLVATCADDTAELRVRLIHFFPSQSAQLAEGKIVRLYGEARQAWGGGLEMIHPKILAPIAQDADTLPHTLTPVYPAGEGITQNWLRKRISRAMLDVSLRDMVPERFLEPLRLPAFEPALRSLHNPPPGADLAAYELRDTPEWRRLKFDELLAQQIALRLSRQYKTRNRALPLSSERQPLTSGFLARLPFQLTGAQQRVCEEIFADLSGTTPMLRLVQGDVGCGKTAVAALAALRAIESGTQACLMAPTELLAEQHIRKLSEWLEPLGVRLAWLSSSLTAKERTAVREQIALGRADLVVGTHALIQDGVVFERLGLAIVDEQHRFGVAQRLKLRNESADTTPHLLMLSATPIPRTLAMSYLADVDVSVIDELPAGRMPVSTKLISARRLPELIASVGHTLSKGQQGYWVCPLIEEKSQEEDTGDRPRRELTAAADRHDTLRRELPHLRIGLVHGAMRNEEKDATMSAFAHGEIDLLVATTVIEVGVDVPNATVMVIEDAQQFGLAQLHQLRGRIGRGTLPGTCALVFADNLSDTAKERLKIIHSSSDGFEIAREDLRLRGPGEFLGENQSGVPMLRFADLTLDTPILEHARLCALDWLESDPDCATRHAMRWFKAALEFMKA